MHSEVSVTTVFVTHNQEEAMEVADELVVMNVGALRLRSGRGRGLGEVETSE
ncbi:MAG: hypothetical protein SFW36_10985 [Leptolyngbyaceae cyanobacterium bins.59]|nr:hypothetical protein [Leptolyngbyaceae cyanobacterium bins.59]